MDTEEEETGTDVSLHAKRDVSSVGADDSFPWISSRDTDFQDDSAEEKLTTSNTPPDDSFP
jgi:hypothetical protein